MEPRNGRRTRRELLAAGAGAAAALTVGGDVLAAVAKPAAARAAVPAQRLGFESLAQEVRLPRLEVEGAMPPWLSGILLRNGPAQFEVGARTFNHWFDGLAMLHAFAFGRGRVSYANRFLRSSAYHAWRDEGAIRYSEFGTDPCRTAFSGVASIPIIAPVPNANVSVEALAARFVAHTEIPIPVRFDPQTLRTLGVRGTPPTGRLGTAHPHYDPVTGERFSYEVALAPPTGYRVLAQRRGKTRVLAEIPRAHPGYMHSFTLTRRFVVLFEQPFLVDPASFFSGPAKPIVDHYAWDASQPARMLVVDRAGGGVVAEAEVEPLFAFHHINATDDGHRVQVDLCGYQDAAVVHALALKRLRAADRRLPRVRPRRITVDLRRRTATTRELADIDIELPRIDYARNQHAYRHAYGIGVHRGATFADQLVKLDVVRGEHRVWREPGSFPGEPVFVPAPHRRREDEGVLLSVVLDPHRHSSFLLVLDAHSLAERARARVPHHIPFGFHGIHVAA